LSQLPTHPAGNYRKMRNTKYTKIPARLATFY